MTRDREFDRLARAWLDLMPDEVPDRAIAAVLDAVERTPQVRRRVDWLRWRESPMTRLSLSAAAAAAVLIAVGGAVMLLRPSGQGPGIGGEPTPLPTPSSSAPASVTPGAGGTPEALRGVWLGDLRVVPGLPTDRSVLEFGESELVYIETQRSDVAAPSPTELTLTAVNAIAGCEVGDVGTYLVAL